MNIKAICCTALVLAGMAGVHYGVEYSVWVLFFALVGVLWS